MALRWWWCCGKAKHTCGVHLCCSCSLFALFLTADVMQEACLMLLVPCFPLHGGLDPSGTTRPNKSFLPSAAFCLEFYPSNTKEAHIFPFPSNECWERTGLPCDSCLPISSPLPGATGISLRHLPHLSSLARPLMIVYTL